MSILPPNATPLEIAFDDLMADRFGSMDASVIRNSWNPDACRADLLPFLAWSLSVDTWDDSWSDAVKRQVIKDSVEVHRKKGTIGAVRKAISSIWTDMKISEWFNYGGQPYRFKAALIAENGFDFNLLGQVHDVIQKSKNVRSNLEELKVTLRQKGNTPYIAAATLSHTRYRILPPFPTDVKLDNPLYIAAYTYSIMKYKILPNGA